MKVHAWRVTLADGSLVEVSLAFGDQWCAAPLNEVAAGAWPVGEFAAIRHVLCVPGMPLKFTSMLSDDNDEAVDVVLAEVVEMEGGPE